MELVRTITQDDMSRYSGPGNIHSDVEVAKRTGLDAPIAQGMQTLALASELMTTVFGAKWIERGEMSVTFTKPVEAGDTVTVGAQGGDGRYEVTAMNQHGDVVMVGEAHLR